MIITGAVFVGWLVASAVVLWSTRAPTDDGLDALERAQEQLDATALLRGGAADIVGVVANGTTTPDEYS